MFVSRTPHRHTPGGLWRLYLKLSVEGFKRKADADESLLMAAQMGLITGILFMRCTSIFNAQGAFEAGFSFVA